jgi:hypothetical protein
MSPNIAAADRSLAVILLGALAAVILVATFLFLLRYVLRRRIRPNKDFPFAPELPIGTPPAMIVNESSGQLEIAPRQEIASSPESQWFDFQIGRHRFPRICCLCLKNAEPNRPCTKTVFDKVQVHVPCCAACSKLWERERLKATVYVFFLAMIVDAVVSFTVAGGEFWLVFVLGSFLSLIFAISVTNSTAVPVKFGRADKARGIIRLRFRNQEYESYIHRGTGDPE